MRLIRLYVYLYEYLLSASSPDEPQVLHNDNNSSVLCFRADPLRSSRVDSDSLLRPMGMCGKDFPPSLSFLPVDLRP